MEPFLSIINDCAAETGKYHEKGYVRIHPNRKHTLIPARWEHLRSALRKRVLYPRNLGRVCRYGFPYDDLSKEGKQMLYAYMKEYRDRCGNDDESWEPKPLLPKGKATL